MKTANFVFGIFIFSLFCSILSAAPSITIEKPNGGEYIVAGGSYEILWTSTDVNAVYIYYSVDSGAYWNPVDTNELEDTGSYLWQPVADEDSQECFLRIVDACDSLNDDISDANFTIYPCLAELKSDLNLDCYVNFKDVAIVANEWLDCGNPYDPDCGLCPLGWADCDMMPGNGCEVYLLTNVYNCGLCDYSCFDLDNVLDVECVDGGCVINSCAGSYDNCDGTADNGCETDLLTSLYNCGSCDNNCLDLDNVSNANCVAGNCIIIDCDSGYENCDGQVSNGCETSIYFDTYNCGACGNSCLDLPHVSSASCSGGACQIQSCASGYGDCDGIADNGCEVNLNDNPDCSMVYYLSSVCGDNGCTAGPMDSYRGEEWYGIYVDECSGSLNDLRFKATLEVPQGMDYDLYLYEDNCTNLVDYSAATGSFDETVYYTWNDNILNDDGRWFYIEVRYWSGQGCSNWTLRTYGDCDE